MSPVLTPAPPQAAPTRLSRNVAAVVVGGLVALVLLFAGTQALEGPGVIEQVTVAGSDGGSQLALGPVAAGEHQAFASVVDQGDRWVVHVTSARSDGGQFVLSRADLERTKWVITIPDDVASRLTANGAAPRTPTG